MSINSELRAELEALRGGGVLDVAAVVEWARENPDSQCYAQLDQRGCWDETTAAESWRIHCARQLIARVTIRPVEDAKPIRAYVHLSSDDRGYRHVRDVSASDALREAMFADLERDVSRLIDKRDTIQAVLGAHMAAQALRTLDAMQRALQKRKGGDGDEAVA